jgi:cytochrome c5
MLFLFFGCSQPLPDGPRMTFDHLEEDLGDVKEGVEIPRAFMVTNTGTQPLTIKPPYSSCGCTVPKLKKTLLLPGESTELEVKIDTSMKQGEVTKTIHVESVDEPVQLANLYLYMNVENRHKNLNANGRAKILTDEKCTSCHVAEGVGQFGKELFKADCAMCHGENAEGKIGPALRNRDLNNPGIRTQIWNVTAYGSKQHASMPGFIEDAGGPLAKEQVDSLVNYLATLKDKK